jgi:hypothetical protein
MAAIRATTLALMLLTACSDAHDWSEFKDWDILNEVGSPIRWEKLTWPIDDESCLAPDGIQVLGELNANEYSRIVSEVREARPRDAILLVRKDGRYADVLTGANCTSPGAGGGDVYYLRFEGVNWRIKGTSKWK